MKVHSRKEQDVQIVEVEGEIDLYTTPDFQGTLQSLIGKGEKLLLIDLKKVSYVDSSGMAAIIEAFRSLKRGGGSLVLCSVNRNVLHVFEIARLDRALNFADDVPAGIKKLKS